MDQPNKSHQLAVLIASPIKAGEAAMHNDMTAMSQALQGRGFSTDQILSLHGRLDRPQVVAFLQAASRRVAAWSEGSVFLHFTGHGFFQGETAAEARPGILFDDIDVADDFHLFWDDFFAALILPAGVRLTLLPDLWHSNLLAGRVPAHTSALVMKALPGAELACRGHDFDLPMGDKALPRGVISYYAAVALADATTVGDWLNGIEALVQRDVQAGSLPGFYRPDLHVLGDVDQLVP